MDAFLEEQFPSNDEPVFETRKEYEAYHNNPPYNWDAPEDNNNMTISDDSESYTVPPHIPSKDTNPAKRLLLPLLKTRPNTKFLKLNLTELPRSLRLNKPCTMNSNVTLPNFQASFKLLPNRPKPDLLNECYRFDNNTGCFSRSWDSSYWKYGSK